MIHSFLRHKKVLLKWLGMLVTLVAVFYIGITIGAQGKRIAITNSRDLINEDFSSFWETVQLLRDRYVDIKDVKDKNLLYGAIAGMVNSLKDPYTAYFPPSDAKKFTQDLAGSFGGIGAEIGVRNNQLVIIAPLKDNPAEKAGVRAGDIILKINDTIVTPDLTVEEAVKLIRGDIKTVVKLSLFREGWKEPKEFPITRDTVVVPTLDMDMKTLKSGDKDISVAHIKLYNFNANASSFFYQSVLSALFKGAKGIVLDLRNNPGGYLDVSVDLAGWFLKRGEVVVRERFRSGDEHIFRTTGNASLADLPLVILVDEGSASASEILAGALRDIRHAKLIGVKTFGKGSVQEVESLKDGSTVKVTVAKWFTTNGGEIDKKGLVPDVEVKVSEKDRETKKDPQLEKALETLSSLLSK